MGDIKYLALGHQVSGSTEHLTPSPELFLHFLIPLHEFCWCSSILRIWIKYPGVGGGVKSTQGPHLQVTPAFGSPNPWMCGVILSLLCNLLGLSGTLSLTLTPTFPLSAVGGKGLLMDRLSLPQPRAF